MAIRRTLAEFSDDIATADIADDAITGGKLANDIAISTTGNIATTGSGTLTVAGTTTLSGDLVPSSHFSHRNVIINGAMQVAQRYTSRSTWNGAGGLYNTVDRFASNMSGLGGHTTAQVEIDDLEGFNYSHKLTSEGSQSTGAADYWYVRYRVEANDMQRFRSGAGAAGTVAMTLSYYVKTSWADTFATSIRSMDGTSRILSSDYTTVANTWQRVSHTFPADATAQYDTNTDSGLEIRWWLTAGSNYTGAQATSIANYSGNTQETGSDPAWTVTGGRTWEITGVQLELGSSATPFEHRSYDDELKRCERYCQVYKNFQSAGFWNGTSNFRSWFLLRTQMRSTPSLTEKDYTSGTRATILWSGSYSLSTSAASIVGYDFGSLYFNRAGYSGGSDMKGGICQHQTWENILDAEL